jgi:uncharacterized protein YggT (Ycf19 family)
MSIASVNEYEQRAQEAEQSSKPTFLKIARGVVWFVYAVVIVIVIFLFTAFVLKLFGASTDAAFTRWVYRNAESAMRPFRGIFPVSDVGEVSVFDPSLLFGAIVYTFIALGLDAIVYRLSKSIAKENQQTAQARAQADAVRLQWEQQQQQARSVAEQQYAAQQFAAQQQAMRLAADDGRSG